MLKKRLNENINNISKEKFNKLEIIKFLIYLKIMKIIILKTQI